MDPEDKPSTKTHSQTLNPPQWVPDSSTESCLCCGEPFGTVTNRRHHCRRCGLVVCKFCSKNKDLLPDLGYLKPVRICTSCQTDKELKTTGQNPSDVISFINFKCANNTRSRKKSMLRMLKKFALEKQQRKLQKSQPGVVILPIHEEFETQPESGFAVIPELRDSFGNGLMEEIKTPSLNGAQNSPNAYPKLPQVSDDVKLRLERQKHAYEMELEAELKAARLDGMASLVLIPPLNPQEAEWSRRLFAITSEGCIILSGVLPAQSTRQRSQPVKLTFHIARMVSSVTEIRREGLQNIDVQKTPQLSELKTAVIIYFAPDSKILPNNVTGQSPATQEQDRGVDSLTFIPIENKKHLQSQSVLDIEEIVHTINAHRDRYFQRVQDQIEVCEKIRVLTNTEVSWASEDHANLLQRIWEIYMPDIEHNFPGDQKSEKWKQIGFQGNDPVTDFRGMGLMAVHAILHFGENHPKLCHDLLAAHRSNERDYPFCASAINCCSMICQLLDIKRVDELRAEEQAPLFQLFCTYKIPERAFYEFFCIIVRILDRVWVASSSSYLDFPDLLNALRQNIEFHLAKRPFSQEVLHQWLLDDISLNNYRDMDYLEQMGNDNSQMRRRLKRHTKSMPVVNYISNS